MHFEWLYDVLANSQHCALLKEKAKGCRSQRSVDFFHWVCLHVRAGILRPLKGKNLKKQSPKAARVFGELAPWLTALTVLPISAPTWWLTTTCGSDSRGSDAFPDPCLHQEQTWGTDVHTGITSTNTKHSKVFLKAVRN